MTRSKAWYAQGTLFLNPDRSWNRILICWSLVQRWHTRAFCTLVCFDVKVRKAAEFDIFIMHFISSLSFVSNYRLFLYEIKSLPSLSGMNTYPSELFSNFILTFFGRVVIFPLPLPCKFRQGLALEFIWPPGRQKKDICGRWTHKFWFFLQKQSPKAQHTRGLSAPTKVTSGWLYWPKYSPKTWPNLASVILT